MRDEDTRLTASAKTPPAPLWSVDAAEVLRRLGSTANGLSAADAALRRARQRHPDVPRLSSRARIFVRQISSPLLWILMFAAVVSAITAEWHDAIIVLIILMATVGIGFWRESSAERALDALRARVHVRATVLREGRPELVEREAVVPGDIILLSAGSLVPADAIVLDATDCFVSEAVLTGESFPGEKAAGIVPSATPVAHRTNCVFLGTNVRSGTARVVAVATGAETELGTIARHLTRPAPQTDFDRGLHRFGYLLTSAMLVIVLVVFAAHMLRGRPPVDTLLFSVALAVGLSPELLPAILTVNLARGAQMMARRGVLVRRLNAIENLGAMDVLCTDKTGTLTEGTVRLEGAYDAEGQPSRDALERAACNAALDAGLSNPLDDAILQASPCDLATVRKIAEIPFDFSRKRVSVVIEDPAGLQIITKGAFNAIVDICDRTADGRPLDAARREILHQRYRDWSADGARVLAVAARPIDRRPAYGRGDESALSFVGFLTFSDRPKEGVIRAFQDLAALGVSVKLITGDNALVARHVASQVGMQTTAVLSGAELARMDAAAVWRAVEHTDVFAEIEPAQKEQIIVALKRHGHVVGFLGDGVNDAPAMHAADTSLSVEQAVDVAREAADFVLLERDLDVIRGGIEEGRQTFANTLKYILTTTSANLGNMLSMAAASLALPFLPLLAGQILLNNLLSDVPAVGIGGDSVDPEMVKRPPRWDMAFIGRFMLSFGVISSVFDLITFVVLLAGFNASVALFRTGWFTESLLTELAIALVVRTRRPFYRSRPGRVLWISTVVMIGVTCLLPFLPGASLLEFVPVPGPLLATLIGIVVLYVLATELWKRVFFARENARS